MVIETDYLEADVSDSKTEVLQTAVLQNQPPGRSSSHYCCSCLGGVEHPLAPPGTRQASICSELQLPACPCRRRPDLAMQAPVRLRHHRPAHRRGKANGHPARVPTTPLPRFDAALHRQFFVHFRRLPGRQAEIRVALLPILPRDREAETHLKHGWPCLDCPQWVPDPKMPSEESNDPGPHSTFFRSVLEP
jgi:hypothetical protein